MDFYGKIKARILVSPADPFCKYETSQWQQLSGRFGPAFYPLIPCDRKKFESGP